MIYTTARHLHECVVQLDDHRLQRATVFPFFEREGKVVSLLLIDLYRREVRVADFQPRRARPAWLTRRLRLRANYADLPALGPHEAERLGELWHFDPWWLLAEPPFHAWPETPRLKATNCVDHLGFANPAMAFRRDLSRVRWAYDAKDENSIRCWRGNLLPSNQPEYDPPAVRTRRPVWILDPLWSR